MSNTTTATSGRSRWVAGALGAPFFALGFMTVLGWLRFSTGFDER